MLGVVGAVVWALVGLVGMLDLSADGETTPQATTAGATPTPTPTAVDPDEDALTQAERRAAARAARRRGDGSRPTTLWPSPAGSCAAGDVVVTPSVPDGHAGSEVTVVLELTTVESPACTWDVDPDDLFVTITDDSTTLWSSQHCPAALPTATAVPRRTTPDEIRFTWNAKESVAGCSVATSWVWPGVYQVTAVARGSVNPVETLFTLGDPEPQAPAEPAEKAERDDDRTPAEADGRGADSDDDGLRRVRGRRDRGRPEPETEEEAAERREKRREALREARRQHRQDQRAERDAG